VANMLFKNSKKNKRDKVSIDYPIPFFHNIWFTLL
jgi:hypothetical protein